MPYDNQGRWYDAPDYSSGYNPDPGAGSYVPPPPSAAAPQYAYTSTPVQPMGASDQLGQLSWYMQMYGLDPNNPDDLQKFQDQWNGATTLPGSNLPNTPEGRATAGENSRQNARSVPVSQSQNWGLLDDYLGTRENVNQPWIDDYQNSVNGTIGSNLGYVQPVMQAAGKVGTAADALTAQTAGWQQQSAQSAFNANAADQRTLGQYQTDVRGALDYSRNTQDTFANALNGQQILSAGGYGPDVQSQAQYAAANPQDIANQEAAYAGLTRFANGQYDYSSTAAHASADPWADQQYRQGIDSLRDTSWGSKDVRVGEADPEAYAAAIDARGKLRDLSSPQVTAAERFIYEQGRLQQEQGERALRGAAVSNLRERGMGGGAAEQLAGVLGARQMSQNRMLGDLGAQKNAIDRSMTALQGYAGLSQAMNANANQIATDNKNRQLAAQGMYVDQSGQLRRDTFTESYQKGVAADRAKEFNIGTRLNATQSQGQLASTMRNQSFNEDFSTKSAADQMAEFNKSQSQISQRWQEQYAADQQRDYTTRQNLIQQGGQQYATTALSGATSVANAGFGVNGAADQRMQGSLMNQSGMGLQSITGQGTAADSALKAGQFGVNTNQSNLGDQQTATGLHIDNNNILTQRKINSFLNKQGANAGDTAITVAGAYTPPKLDDGYDNDFDRWQNSNRGAHDFDS